jgi:hypothetical protein
MPRITLFTATPPFDDPWHDFRATTDEIVRILVARGQDVRLVDSLDDVVEAVDDCDLFIANCSADQGEVAAPFDALDAAFGRLRQRGGSVLSVHASLLAFQALPEWANLLGCSWNHPVSMHPQKGWAVVQVAEVESPITAGLVAFRVYDERYARLQVDGTVEGLLFHTLEGDTHPLLWKRSVGRARVVVDALGHGLESFDSPEHRLVFERSLDWLTEPK